MSATLELPSLSPRYIVGIFPDGEEEAQCIRVGQAGRYSMIYDVCLSRSFSLSL
ncbi:MAG: hypothetical protein LBF50_03840 [Azoarcus sp.]|jgi:hypothetical protein|nr:hypothetical protein [Azoarcus sp.]